MDTQSLFARRYALGRTLGSAGMGTVYEATDVVTRQAVAVKVLKKVTHENVRRLRREAEIGKALVNEHVRKVLRYGTANDAPYIVMELLEGETLSARVRATGGLAAADAIAVGLQLLEALEAAHSLGILHRDVKPANVFVTSPRGTSPTTKLFDFGLARRIVPLRNVADADEDADEPTDITATGIVPGTPRYLTPEQLSGARDLDGRVDVWAAALTLYEALAGRPAYRGSTDALVVQICYAPPPSIRTVRADVPSDLDEVLACALSKERAQRYTTPREFRDALVGVWARYRAAGVAAGKRYRA